MPLVAENGMDWMYANCSTTAQRGALDWWKRFRDATKPVFEELYGEVAAGNEAQRSIDLNSKPDYRENSTKSCARCAKARCGRQAPWCANSARRTTDPPGGLAIFQIVSRSGGSYPPPPAPPVNPVFSESPPRRGLERRRRGGIPAAGHRQPAINSFVT